MDRDAIDPPLKKFQKELSAGTVSLALLAVLGRAAEPQAGAAKAPPVKSMQDILDAAPASAWRTLDPANTLYLELATGRVVIELAPDFAPAHAANIRTLAKEGYWDGLAIIRSQDNYVVQWGDPNDDDPAKKSGKPLGSAKAKLPAEFERSSEGVLSGKQSALYPVLRNMEGAGLLESHVEPSVAGPPRRYYRITGAGRDALRDWAAAWRATRDSVDSVLGDTA